MYSKAVHNVRISKLDLEIAAEISSRIFFVLLRLLHY